MKLCIDCGAAADRGWSDGEPHDRCAACEVARVLGPLRPAKSDTPALVECGCGCGRLGAQLKRGMVDTCYRRWLRYHKAALLPYKRERVTRCVICGLKCHARGYCRKHWDRWKKYGDPLIVHSTNGRLIRGG